MRVICGLASGKLSAATQIHQITVKSQTSFGKTWQWVIPCLGRQTENKNPRAAAGDDLESCDLRAGNLRLKNNYSEPLPNQLHAAKALHKNLHARPSLFEMTLVLPAQPGSAPDAKDAEDFAQNEHVRSMPAPPRAHLQAGPKNPKTASELSQMRDDEGAGFDRLYMTHIVWRPCS